MARIPMNEKINGFRVRVYDNPKYIDRYTVFYMDEHEGDRFYSCLAMNAIPLSPNFGFTQHSCGVPGKHTGRRILFADMPADCQTVAMRDLEVPND